MNVTFMERNKLAREANKKKKHSILPLSVEYLKCEYNLAK